MNKNQDMLQALQRLRSLTALEVRAIASETRVNVSESLEIATKLQLELEAMKLGEVLHRYAQQRTDCAS